MVYGFYYSDDTILYLQVGLSSKRKARDGLENIAFIFCKEGKSATGRVDKIKKRGVKVLEEYDIEWVLRLKKRDYNKTRANGTP